MKWSLRVVNAALLFCLFEGESSAAPVQNPKLLAIPPNTAIDLGMYGCENPAGASGRCGAITDYSSMVYDHHRHQLLMFGGGHAGSSGTLRSDVSVFDFTTLTWKSDYAATSCADMNVGNIDTTNGAWLSTGQPMARHTYDMLVMADDPPEMFMLTSGSLGPETCSGAPAPADFKLETRVAGYNPDSKKWSFRKPNPGQWSPYATAEHDPISKATILLGSGGYWVYDAKADEFLATQSLPVELGYANNLVYAPNADRMYFFARGDQTRVFELALDRAAWKTSTLTELVGSEGPTTPESGFAYDSVNGVVGGGIVDGKFLAFDPKTKTWKTAVMNTDPPGAAIGAIAFHALAFDPVDGVFVFITDYASGGHVWAYRYAGAPPAAPQNTDAGGGNAEDGGSGGSTGGGTAPSSDETPSEESSSGCHVAQSESSSQAASVFVSVAVLAGFARLRRRRRSVSSRARH